eukprot:UN32689
MKKLEAEGKTLPTESQNMEMIRQRQGASTGSSLLDSAISYVSQQAVGRRQPLKQGGTGGGSSFLDGLRRGGPGDPHINPYTRYRFLIKCSSN